MTTTVTLAPRRRRPARRADRDHQQPRLRQRPGDPVDRPARRAPRRSRSRTRSSRPSWSTSRPPRSPRPSTGCSTARVKQPPPVQQGASGLSWMFTWDIGPTDAGTLDGPYILSAEAFNQYGVSGPGRQETVILNRRQPFAPRRVTGGRTIFGTVEIEWDANSERDIIGYEVRRLDATGTTVVCAAGRPAARDQLHRHRAPPAADPLRYAVYAYDRDPAGASREGDASAIAPSSRATRRRSRRPALAATRAADGTRDADLVRPCPGRPGRRPTASSSTGSIATARRSGTATTGGSTPGPNVDVAGHRTDGLEHVLGDGGGHAAHASRLRGTGDQVTRLRDEAGSHAVEVLVASVISLVILGATLTAFTGLVRQSAARRAPDRGRDGGAPGRRPARAPAPQPRQPRRHHHDVTTSTQPKSVDRNLPHDLIFKDIDDMRPAGSRQQRERAARPLLPADSGAVPAPASRRPDARRAVDADADVDDRAAARRDAGGEPTAPAPAGRPSGSSPTTSSTPRRRRRARSSATPATPAW